MNIKQICSAIYFNAGVIISSIIFIFADPSKLELGKVFSTIALLGYIFNFSILYSNYALEALYKIIVFNQRIDQIVLKAQEYSKKVVVNQQFLNTFDQPKFGESQSPNDLKAFQMDDDISKSTT